MIRARYIGPYGRQAERAWLNLLDEVNDQPDEDAGDGNAKNDERGQVRVVGRGRLLEVVHVA